MFVSRLLQVLDLAANIFKQIPENIDYSGTAKILSVDPSPLNVVLLQEVSNYLLSLSLSLSLCLCVLLYYFPVFLSSCLFSLFLSFYHLNY